MITGALALPAVLAAAAAAPSQPTEEIFAILVGHNGAAEDLPTLRFADDDAVRFALFFAGLSAPDHVWLLTELDAETTADLARAGLAAPAARPPTRAHLFAALAEVRQRLRARDRTRPAAVYFVYAGHGLHGRFLLEPEAAAVAALTGRELRAAVADLGADRTTLLIDACRSQSLFVERGDPPPGPDLAGAVADLERRAGAAKIGILAAATHDRPAGELAELRSGYFSHVLASGLAGAADADGDDVITFGELAAFVAFNTVRSGRQQRPWFDPPGGDLGAPAIDHRGRTTRLVIGAAGEGRYRVGAPAGSPVFVEANKAPGHPLRLALPPGRYQVVRQASPGRGSAVEVEVTRGLAREITAADPTRSVAFGSAARDRGESPGGPQAQAEGDPGFQAPFTPEVVSTLAAGYQAGREPTAMRNPWRHELRIGYGMGTAPLDLAGFEHAVDVGYRRAFRHFFLGLRSDYRVSVHRPALEAYQIRRTGLAAEGGTRLIPMARLEIGASAGGGVRSIYRVAAGRLSGDPAAPVAGAAVHVGLEMGAGIAVYAELRSELSWVRIDERRKTFGELRGGVGLGYRR